MRRSPYRVHVQAGAACGGTNQAIGHRCHLLAWAFGPASFVPRVNAAFGNTKGEIHMTYREQQRRKVTSIREAFFKDPGNGIFYCKEREFALSDLSY